MSRGSLPAYGLLEAVGLELEYAVVDDELRPRCLVEELFRRLAGRAVSAIEEEAVGFSNELAAHVFEIKTPAPHARLSEAEPPLVAGLRRVQTVLREQLGARLLPTGMHPFMRPRDTELWRRAGREIYRAYARVFSIREHGWLNLQSCHVNLSFGSEEETIALHNAVACLLPYLPALAASSPIYCGEIGPVLDNRLAFYARNQRRIPVISGEVVPEFVSSFRQYRSRILRPIYDALAEREGAERLRHEWVNSRGAILRFGRRAIEIRALDTQECPKMDVAVAVFVRGALRSLVDKLLGGELRLPEHGMLVSDLRAAIAEGSASEVRAAHLRRGAAGAALISARRVLEDLLEDAERTVAAAERPYLGLVEARLRRGSLAESIARAVRRGTARTPRRRETVIRDVYEELADCLWRNAVWEPSLSRR
jgi:carboxylate-amine ligase